MITLRSPGNPVTCVSLYDVTYQEVSRGVPLSKLVQASLRYFFTLTDELDTCSEYEIRVSAVIGDKYSGEQIETVITDPDDNTSDKLQPIIIPSSNSVSAKLNGFDTFDCVKNKVMIT